MLIDTLGVVAGSAHTFKRTQRLLRVNLMTVSQGKKATLHVVREVGMITVRLELSQGTFVRVETPGIDLIIRYSRLDGVSYFPLWNRRPTGSAVGSRIASTALGCSSGARSSATDKEDFGTTSDAADTPFAVSDIDS